MSNEIFNAITGRAVRVVIDGKVCSAITGREIGGVCKAQNIDNRTARNSVVVTEPCYRVSGSSYPGLDGDYVDTGYVTAIMSPIYKNKKSNIYLSIYKDTEDFYKNWAFMDSECGSDKMYWETGILISHNENIVFYLGAEGSSVPATPIMSDGYEYKAGKKANGATPPTLIGYLEP